MYRGLVSRTRHHIATIRTSCKHHCLSCSRKFKFLLQIFGLERVRKQNQTIWPSFQQHLSEIPRFEVPRSSIFWNSLSIAVFGVEFVEHYSSWWPSPAPSSMVLRNYYRTYRFFTHFQNSRSCILESCNSLDFVHHGVGYGSGFGFFGISSFQCFVALTPTKHCNAQPQKIRAA